MRQTTPIRENLNDESFGSITPRPWVDFRGEWRGRGVSGSLGKNNQCQKQLSRQGLDENQVDSPETCRFCRSGPNLDRDSSHRHQKPSDADAQRDEEDHVKTTRVAVRVAVRAGPSTALFRVPSPAPMRSHPHRDWPSNPTKKQNEFCRTSKENQVRPASLASLRPKRVGTKIPVCDLSGIANMANMTGGLWVAFM